MQGTKYQINNINRYFFYSAIPTALLFAQGAVQYNDNINKKILKLKMKIKKYVYINR